jgi:serine/threonine protein kinase
VRGSDIAPSVAELIEELANRVQAGERVDLEAVIAAHPEHTEQLRRLLPAVEVLADVGRSAIAADSAPPRVEGDAEPPSGVLGDFRIIRDVGRGGMGIVYEAEQISLGRRVALKVLPFAATLDPRQLQRFQNEARAAAGLHHTNIVPVYAVGCERGVHYYAMQFIDGRTLAEFIADQRPDAAAPAGANASAATVPPAARVTITAPRDAAYFRRAAEWGIQAAEALQHAHELGVVHRDVKPGNLMLDERGTLWVTDFGLARVQAGASLTLTGDLVGTVRYMSPEQAQGQQTAIDHRTDVYSLGATLYELLTLQPAFNGTGRQELLRQITSEEPSQPRRINRAIPAQLETIVLKAMEKSPQDRYATAQELADDLERYLRDQPIRARRPSILQRARKWGRRHRAAVTAVAIGLVMTLVAVAGSVGWVLGDRGARRGEAEAKVQEALETAAPGMEQGDPWDRSLIAAAQRAEAQLNSGVVGPEVRRQVEQLLRDVDMLARVEQARLQSAAAGRGTTFDLAGADRLYAAAFTAYGVDVIALEPHEAAEGVRQSQISARLITALDDWAMVRDILQDRGGLPIHKVIDRADEDPWRRRVRVAKGRRDRAALEELARGDEVLSQPPAHVVLLARTLATDHGSWTAAERLLRRVLPGHQGDFWVNFELGTTLDRKNPPDWADATRFYQAALAVRPESAVACNNLGVALK